MGAAVQPSLPIEAHRWLKKANNSPADRSRQPCPTCRYPISSYVKLPAALQPFVELPWLDHYLVVARPTMDKSGGLHNYRVRSCTRRDTRALAHSMHGARDLYSSRGCVWDASPCALLVC